MCDGNSCYPNVSDLSGSVSNAFSNVTGMQPYQCNVKNTPGASKTYDEESCRYYNVNRTIRQNANARVKTIMKILFWTIFIICGCIASVISWSTKLLDKNIIIRIFLAFLHFPFGIIYLLFLFFMNTQSKLDTLVQELK